MLHQAAWQELCLHRWHESRAHGLPKAGERKLELPPLTPPLQGTQGHAQALREACGDGSRLCQLRRHQNYGQAEIDTSAQETHGDASGALAALAAAETQPLFEIGTNLTGAASGLARVIGLMKSAATGAPSSSGLLCKLLVYAHKDLKELDVLKQGMAHWNGLSS